MVRLKRRVYCQAGFLTRRPRSVVYHQVDGDVWVPVAEDLVFDAFGSLGLFLLRGFSASGQQVGRLGIILFLEPVEE